jgi:hypothetical protein
MVWHIHFKNGKFAIWSTVVDDYITEWANAGEIKAYYLGHGHTGNIDWFIRQAKANNGCCWGREDLAIEERIGRMNRGEEPMIAL